MRPQVERPLPGPLPLDVLHEFEACNNRGSLASVLTVLLRGSECSYRCLMCDLWKSTHLGKTPVGNIPAQIRFAMAAHQNPRLAPSANVDPRLAPSANAVDLIGLRRWIKLYNAANFFAPANIPTEDLPEIASLVEAFDRVIVENHPRLLTRTIHEFASRIGGKLEVAMGLETIEPQVLSSLNKQLTVEDVQRAVEWLEQSGIDSRLFVLLRPPGLDEQSAVDWCQTAIDAARSWGVRHVSIIPVRTGNGAMEYLNSIGQFEPPRASSLEQVLNQNVGRSSMIVTADLWDWHRLRGLCDKCSVTRRTNLERVNFSQRPTAYVNCECECA